MYYSYEKKQAQYTTYELLHPDYEQMPEDTARITELCTIDNITYVHISDGLILPTQPKQITLKQITMTPQLKARIRQASPHVKLMEKRMAKNEDVRLTKQDENTLGFLSEFMDSPVACTDYVAKRREWDKVEKKGK